MDDLESKLEGEHHWKYWIPIYGMFSVTRYGNRGRPTFVRDANSAMGLLYVGYQSMVSMGTVAYILYRVLD